MTIGTVADFISEPWPASNQKPGRFHVGTTGRLASESATSTDQLHLPRKPTVDGVGREIVPVGRQGFELRQHSGIQKRRKSGVSKLRTKWAQS
jgi:hypothetical protein